MKRRLPCSGKLDESNYDILIVGGGITGAGAFLEASRKGYKTILVEKGDFASGTSSRSAKLAHGGIRYLRYLHFGLVREALLQRDYLLKTYPHLVKPLRFLYPIYSTSLKIQVFLGMAVYQILNITSDLVGFDFLSKRKTLEKFPAINGNSLKGSYQYYDAVTNDARLCNEIIHEAIRDYSTTALNYFELTDFNSKSGHVVAKCFDHIEQKEKTITAKYMINASGPWIDELSEKVFQNRTEITAPSKGTHLVLSQKRFPLEDSLLFTTTVNDGRILYTVPWENDTVVVGATDTEYSEGIDEVKVDVADDDYILDSLNQVVPALGISKEDIISSFAGIRPLMKDENLSSKDRSREYKIWWVQDLVLNMFGGKLTGFQSMAAKAIKMIDEIGAKPHVPIKKNEPNSTSLNTDNIPTNIISHLRDNYNKESIKVLQICLENPSAMEKLHPDFNIYKAEVIYFARFQSCYHIDDVLGRRLSLSYVLPKFKEQKEVVRTTADVLRTECDWSEEEYQHEQESYLNLLKQKNLYL